MVDGWWYGELCGNLAGGEQGYMGSFPFIPLYSLLKLSSFKNFKNTLKIIVNELKP